MRRSTYFDQQSLARTMALSKDIDEGHKKEVAEQCIVSQDLADQEQIERVYIDKFSDNELRNCETSINVSQN